MPAKKRRTTAKQKTAARKNIKKAQKKWQGMSSKARKKAMPNPSRKKPTKRKVSKKKTTRKKR